MEQMSFESRVREKLISHPFNVLEVHPRPKRKRIYDKENDNFRSRKSYHKRKEEDPEGFKQKQKEKNAAKYAARKADPIKWERYLEQCRRSKAKKRLEHKSVA